MPTDWILYLQKQEEKDADWEPKGGSNNHKNGMRGTHPGHFGDKSCQLFGAKLGKVHPEQRERKEDIT